MELGLGKLFSRRTTQAVAPHTHIAPEQIQTEIRTIAQASGIARSCLFERPELFNTSEPAQSALKFLRENGFDMELSGPIAGDVFKKSN